MKIKLSAKFKDFLRFDDFDFAFLESCTSAGKTTVGAIKFMLSVAQSPKKFHALCGLDNGVVERNIINKDCGILDVFGDTVQYLPNGHGGIKLPHLVLHAGKSDKIIYIVGYDNSARWVKVLGSQFGVIFVDEANRADLAFIQEITMRCDRAYFTQNPDDPSLDWYKQYVNHSRPLARYRSDYPAELLGMLNEPEKPRWVHWYFTFDDNAALSEEKRRRIIDAVPVGTKQYFTKILGLRRRTTGLVFSNFDPKRHIVTREWAKKLRDKSADEHFVQFSCGLDTSYSSKSSDTLAFSFLGITNKRRVIVLDELVRNNSELAVPFAPSDTVQTLVDFAQRCCDEWGVVRDLFIDSADQATLQECAKYSREHGCFFNFNNAWKKMQIINRINLQLGWFAHDEMLIVENCTEYISELGRYCWLENKDSTPEDGNDHMINSVQYGFLPFVDLVGGIISEPH